MAIRVGNIQELLPKLKAAGVRVISKDQAAGRVGREDAQRVREGSQRPSD
jgi:hypothetical protein